MKASTLEQGKAGGILEGAETKGVEVQASGVQILESSYCSGVESHNMSSSEELVLEETCSSGLSSGVKSMSGSCGMGKIGKPSSKCWSDSSQPCFRSFFIGV